MSYRILKEAKENLGLILIAFSFIALSFGSFLVLDDDLICKLGVEDGFFEYLTAVLFASASLVLARMFFRTRNRFFLLLSLLLLLGSLEEIAWGQRLIGFPTPPVINKINVQHEATIHNLEPVDSSHFDGTPKTGWERLITINSLYKMFWFVYGIAIPLGFCWISSVRRILEEAKLPIPPLTLGIFFFFNYLIMKTMDYSLAGHRSPQYLDSATEIYECGTALVFFVISLYFLKTAKKWGTGEETSVRPS